MRANEYAAVHACIAVGMPRFRVRVCMALHARDGVRAATFRRVRVHVFSTPRDRCITNHRDGRTSVRTVRDGVWGGSSSLRNFAQSGLYGAENPGFVRSAPTVAVHLRGHADDACDMRGCVSNRSRPPTRTSRKTPCFMCFFEQDRCRRSEEHTSELQSLMRISYAVFCLKKKT